MAAEGLKKLIKETKEISRRILRELLNQTKPKPQLQPIPVTVTRYARCISKSNQCIIKRYYSWNPCNQLTRWRFNILRSIIGKSKISYNDSFVQSCQPFQSYGHFYNHFSQANQNTFRGKLYSNMNKSFWAKLIKFRFNSYKLNINSENHHLILTLAKSERNINPNCYVDFPINFSLNINETLLTGDVCEELSNNINLFQRKLSLLQLNINSLLELGELPINYDYNKNVLRIHFPNCDREKVKVLLEEKGIVGGIIVEDHVNRRDISEIKDTISSASSVSSASIFEESIFGEESVMDHSLIEAITDSNLLSSGSLYLTDDSGSILSETSDSLDVRLVRLTDNVQMSPIVNIESYDDFYWV